MPLGNSEMQQFHDAIADRSCFLTVHGRFVTQGVFVTVESMFRKAFIAVLCPRHAVQSFEANEISCCHSGGSMVHCVEYVVDGGVAKRAGYKLPDAYCVIRLNVPQDWDVLPAKLCKAEESLSGLAVSQWAAADDADAGLATPPVPRLCVSAVGETQLSTGAPHWAKDEDGLLLLRGLQVCSASAEGSQETCVLAANIKLEQAMSAPRLSRAKCPDIDPAKLLRAPACGLPVATYIVPPGAALSQVLEDCTVMDYCKSLSAEDRETMIRAALAFGGHDSEDLHDLLSHHIVFWPAFISWAPCNAFLSPAEDPTAVPASFSAERTGVYSELMKLEAQMLAKAKVTKVCDTLQVAHVLGAQLRKPHRLVPDEWADDSTPKQPL